jgi:membrane protease subunit HflK
MANDPGKPIEQVMDELNKIFANMGINTKRRHGGGNGGNGANGGGKDSGFQSGHSPLPFLLGATALVLVIWASFTSFYTVDQSAAGVVIRFGKYVRTDPPGLHFKLPFGIEKNINVPAKRLLKEEFGFRTKDTRQTPTRYAKELFTIESLMLTGDLNIADVEWVVQYTITDPWKYLFHAADPEKNIRDVSISVMRRVVGDMLVSDVLGRARTEIAVKAKELAQSILDRYDMGVTIQNFLLQGVNPPELVKPAFNEVNAAKQEQEESINKAEQEYNKTIPEAKGKAAKVISDAEAYATEILNRSKGDADRFKNVLDSYKLAPNVTRKRMYLEAMQVIFEDADRFTIVDPNVKGVLPLYGQTTKLPAEK